MDHFMCCKWPFATNYSTFGVEVHVHRKGSDHWSEAGVWGEGGGGTVLFEVGYQLQNYSPFLAMDKP